MEYTLEIVTAFTKLTGETNKYTNKQLQVVIKCYERAVQTPGLCTIQVEYLISREKFKMQMRQTKVIYSFNK